MRSFPGDTTSEHGKETHGNAKPSDSGKMLWSQILRHPRVLLTLGGILLLSYAVLWIYRFTVRQLGPFAPLAFVVVGGLIVVLVGPWTLIHYRAQIKRALGSGIDWLWSHTGAAQAVHRMQERYPRMSRFLAARLTSGTRTGLGLTMGILIAGAVGWFFLELLIEIAGGSPIAGADRRIINLVTTLRTPEIDGLMLLVTFLGNVEPMLVLAAIVLIITLLWRRYEAAALLLLSLVASTLFYGIITLLVGRHQPLLAHGGFSFQSAHTAVSATIYGTLAYLLIHELRSELAKVLVGMSAALVVLAIGLSRMYFGIHYPSDVVAGWIAGVFWFVLLALVEHLWSNTPGHPLSGTHSLLALGGSLLSLVCGVFYLTSIYQTISPPQPNLTLVVPKVITRDAVSAEVTHLPNHTETLLGAHQEPISVILVGTQDTHERAFRTAGWTEADKLSLASVTKVIRVSLQHQSDPAGPVTPSFLAEQPNTLAFNQPVGTTFEQRHHIRIWRTQVQTTDGQVLWLATASFDQGFELGSTTFLPTHQIAPDIDNERDYIATSLQNAATVTKSVTIQLVPPEFGRNLAGDPFFTYGKAVVLWLH